MVWVQVGKGKAASGSGSIAAKNSLSMQENPNLRNSSVN